MVLFVRHMYNSVHKCQELKISITYNPTFLALLLAKEKKYDALLSGQPM